MSNNSYLSNKDIPVQERLIFALDVAKVSEAKKIVEELGETICFYKLGLELLMSGGYFELIDWLSNKGKKVFADIKFNDVPETVSSAIRKLKEYKGINFVTVHSNDEALKIVNKEKGHLKILAVTVLTSMDRGDLNSLGFPFEFKKDKDVKKLVLFRAKRALNAGCDGVISSGLEASELRNYLGNKFIIISPGIRPVDNVENPDDDQKRIVDIEQAFANGADYIVMGRPIKKNYKKYYNLDSPKEAAMHIQERIKKIFNQ